MTKQTISGKEMFNRALELAIEAHKGQTDRGGLAYIMHPIHVATQMQTPAAMTVAILHDCLEDTRLSVARLREEGFPQHIIRAVQLLTRKPGADYEQYIYKISRNPLARVVKIADIKHNMSVDRMEGIKPKEAKRLKKYFAALKVLEAAEQKLRA